MSTYQQPQLNSDQLAAIRGANYPAATNPILTYADIEDFKDIKGNKFYVGSSNDNFYYFLARTHQGDIITPGFRYDKANKLWEVSVDGTVWSDIKKLNNDYFSKSNDTADTIYEGLVNKFLTLNSVDFNHIKSSNSPINSYVLSYDGILGGFKWVDASSLIVIPPADNRVGTPTDGTFTDGLLSIYPNTTNADAIDYINSVLKELAPDKPVELSGDIYNLKNSNNQAITLYSGNISYDQSRAGSRLITYSQGMYINTIIYSNSLYAAIPTFGQADVGILELYFNDNLVDSINLESNFNESLRDTRQEWTTQEPLVSPNGYINIFSVEKHNNFKKWQKAQGNIYIGTIFGTTNLSLGENSIYLRHIFNGVQVGITNTLRIFYNGVSNPTITNTVIAEDTPVIKYLTGVKYYFIGSTFKISAQTSSILNITNTNTIIRAHIITTVSDINISDQAVISVTKTGPKFDENPQLNNKSLTLLSTNYGGQLYGDITPKYPKGSGVISPFLLEGSLVNTYNSYSTNKVENCVDENYRIPEGDYNSPLSNITGNWNSVTPWSDGKLILKDHYIMYPNLVIANPKPAQTLNITSNATNYYLRVFNDIMGHSSGVLRIYAELSNGATIESMILSIKAPSQTGWLDLNTGFNIATFSAADGDGCRTSKIIESNITSIGWTIGKKSTAESSNQVILKIGMSNSDIKIYNIEIIFN